MSRDVRTVGLYARISLDRRDGEGVGRQLADCRALAADRWPKADVLEFVDNDLSAFHGRRRPAYEQLLDAVRGRDVGAVIAYHADRLYRHPRDLEAFIAVVEAAGAAVATVKAGDVDLATASGRMVARILGAVSRQESERIGERVSRAKKERASQGRHPGGGNRPFGLTEDRTDIVGNEAFAIQHVAANIIAGASWYSEVEKLNDAEIRTPKGNRWTIGTLRRALTSPHVAGLKAYRGEIIGPAIWPPILDRDVWDQLREAAAGRKGGRRPSGRYLLTGLLECHHCYRPLFSNPGRRGGGAYQCRAHLSTKAKGCGRTSISMAKIDEHVRATIRGWLTDDGIIESIDAWFAGYDDTDAAAELATIDRQLAKARKMWTAGDLTDPEFDEIHGDLKARQTAVAERAALRTRPRVDITAAVLVATFDDMTVEEQRNLVATICATPIVVGPGLTSARTARPVEERVNVRPAWEASPRLGIADGRGGVYGARPRRTGTGES